MNQPLLRRWPVALLLVVLLAAAGLRVQHLRADPPRLLPALSGSAGIYFDEGIYSHNARNKLLFGTWITDEWNPFIYNPLLTGIYYLAFRVGGISIPTVKLVNIGFGLLGLILFYLAIRSWLSAAAALVLTALLAGDYYWLMYNRIGLLENFSSLCFLLSFYLFVKALADRRFAFWLGAAVMISVLSKYLFVYFLVSTSLAVVIHARQKRDGKFPMLYLAGLLSLGGLWLFSLYLPFSATFGKIGRGWGMLSLPRSLHQAAANLLANPLPRYLALMPLPFFLALLFFALVIVRWLWRRPSGHDPVGWFVWFWFAGGFLQMGLLNYRPLRYYLPLIPALYLAVARLLRDREQARQLAGRIILMAVPLLVLAGGLFLFLLVPPSAFFAIPLWLRILVYGALAWLLLDPLLPGGIRRWSGPVLAVVILLCALSLYHRHFFRYPTYHLEAAASFIKNLPPDSLVMGQEAPRLTLETGFKALMAYENWFNDRDPFRLHRPTHLLVLNKFNDAELGWIRRRFPEQAGNFVLQKKFPVWDTTLSLYRVVYPEAPDR